jgi:hypothetical protein
MSEVTVRLEAAALEAIAEIARLRTWLGDSEMTVAKLRAALEVTPERIEKTAKIIAYELGYTWGSSALHHDDFREAARKALAKEEGK